MLCGLIDRTFTLVSSPFDSSSMTCHRSLLSALLVFHLGFVDSTDSFVINKTSPAYFSHTLAYFAWFGRCRLGNHLTGNQETIRWIQAFRLNETRQPKLTQAPHWFLWTGQTTQDNRLYTLRGTQFGHVISLVPSQFSTFHSTAVHHPTLSIFLYSILFWYNCMTKICPSTAPQVNKNRCGARVSLEVGSVVSLLAVRPGQERYYLPSLLSPSFGRQR